MEAAIFFCGISKVDLIMGLMDYKEKFLLTQLIYTNWTKQKAKNF